MPASTLIPKLIAAIGATVAIVVGLHTYTLPNHAGAAYADIHDLISRVLGDPRPRLPGAPASLPLQQLPPPDTIEPAPATDSALTQPETWVRHARARDSMALRGWLAPLVLVTAAVQRDTVATTLWRMTFRPGCPWISRLHGISVGQATTAPRLVHLSGDCPAVSP